jgi:hypothetical protein
MCIADSLSRFDIQSLNIQLNKDNELTIVSGSENCIISSITFLIPMRTALIFKEQAKVKNIGLRE